MKYLAALALGSALAAPFAANAGGVAQPVPEPVVAAPVVQVTPTMNWTGWYGGVSLGYGDVNTSQNLANGSGVIGGLLGGYRYDFGTWVLGGEADYDWANSSLGDNGPTSLDQVYRFKLQAGVPVGPGGRTFVYGTAGVARANTTSPTGDGVSSNGWVAGLGADYAINANWIVGGEVLYNQFNDFANSGVDGDLTTIKARLLYKF